MTNNKISTVLGTAVIIIFAITVGLLVWKWGKNQAHQETQFQKITIPIKKTNQPTVPSQNSEQSSPIEFPTVPIQPGLSMEDIIKQAIYEKTPDWKNRNYDIRVTVEINKEDHAIGRFVYDGYNIIKDGSKHHNTGELIWFAAKSDEGWTLVETSAVGYWGSCQNFEKYKFPSDMLPDCWDEEKNVIIDTSNPKRFYQAGFVKADKKALVQAFVSFMKKQKDSGKFVPESYLQKDLYVRVNKKVDNYIYGAILIGGSQNISAPYFLAVKKNGNWIVVHNGQDIPNCSAIEPYKFPHEIISKCYDEINKKEKEVL